MVVIEIGTRFEGLTGDREEHPRQQLLDRLKQARQEGWMVEQDVVSSNWRAIRYSQLPREWRDQKKTCYFVPVSRPGTATTEILLRPLLTSFLQLSEGLCFVDRYKREDDRHLSVLREEDGRYLLETYTEPYPPHPYVAEYAGCLAMPAPKAFKEPVYTD